MSIYDLSTTASDNTTVGGIGVQEGMAPGLVNNAIRGLGADLRKWMNDLGGAATASGSANALTLTTSSSLSNYADGFMVSFVAAATNTGAATLSVDGVGAKAIRKNGDAALVGGEVLAGAHYLAQYDASANSGSGAWLLINPSVVYGASIAALDSLTPAADRVPYFTGTTTAALATFTTFGRSLVDDADAATARTTLGLGTIATQAASAVALTGGTADGVVIGGSTPAAGTFTTLASTGNTTLGDASADTLTINALAVSIPNGLNFDSNTLFIDAANNRVGIGTNTTVNELDVNGAVGVAYGEGLRLYRDTGTTNNAILHMTFSSGDVLNIAPAGNGVNSYIAFKTALSSTLAEKARIDNSGNLLVGKTTGSEKVDVNGSVNATGFKVGGTALAITTKSASSGTAYTNGTDVTYAHGLGVEPDLVSVVLQCTTIDATWAVGDRVIPVGGIQIQKDGTNVVVHVQNTGISILDKGGNTATTATAARWEMYVEAYA